MAAESTSFVEEQASTSYKVKDGRMQGVIMVKPIVIGSVAEMIPVEKRQEDRTHAWKLYLKPYFDEDLSLFVRKVVFKLHDSYVEPNRVVTEPPYEINETGWGEFEAVVRVFFTDSAERPVNIRHIIRLFSPDPEVMAGTKPMVSESYDELIFVQPSVMLYDALMKGEGPPKPKALIHAHDYEAKQEEYIEKVKNALPIIEEEINVLKENLSIMREQVDLWNSLPDEEDSASDVFSQAEGDRDTDFEDFDFDEDEDDEDGEDDEDDEDDEEGEEKDEMEEKEENDEMMSDFKMEEGEEEQVEKELAKAEESVLGAL